MSSHSGGGGGGTYWDRYAPLVDPGTDCEDELPAPADMPAVDNQDMDSELQSVFIDVVLLPTMITPVSEVDRALCAPEYVDAVIQPFYPLCPGLLRLRHRRSRVDCRRFGLRHPQQQWGFHQKEVHLR